MKISEQLQSYIDFISKKNPNYHFEIITFDDFYGISLVSRFDSEKNLFSYSIKTIKFGSIDTLSTYLDRKSAEEVYNILTQYANNLILNGPYD